MLLQRGTQNVYQIGAAIEITQTLLLDPYADYSVYDMFTDTNSVTLANHTPDKDTAGNGWVDIHANALTIQSNSLDTNGNTEESCALDTSEADVRVTCETMIAGTYVGLMARATGSGVNWILAQVQSSENQYNLFACEGSYTSIGTSAKTIDPGDSFTNFELNVNGTALKCIDNGVTKISATNDAHETETRHGVYGYNEDGTADWDNFGVRAL